MTRQIKFRVWSDSDKKMREVKILDLHCEHITVEYRREKINETDTMIYDADLEMNNPHIHLMQFTGLLDKNGKEIYEGDIVNMHYFFSNFNQSTFGVFEDEKTVQGVVGIDYIGTFTLVDGDELYWLNYLQEASEELEVIGNIHEVKNEYLSD